MKEPTSKCQVSRRHRSISLGQCCRLLHKVIYHAIVFYRPKNSLLASKEVSWGEERGMMEQGSRQKFGISILKTKYSDRRQLRATLSLVQ